MKIAISQPTFLPWIGYFDIIRSVDAFVFLDNVQYLPASWMQRNQIKTPQGLQWLTVPVKKSAHSRPLLREVEVVRDAFPEKQLRTIEMNYAKCEHFPALFPWLREQLTLPSDSSSLARLNARFIEAAARRLGIETKFLWASDLAVEGKRSELLVAICKALGASAYHSTAGAEAYMREERAVFDAAGVGCYMHRYEHPVYRQRFGDFLPYACVADLLLNEGEAALGILAGGLRSWEKL